MSKLDAYISSIKNPAKKAYAIAYAKWAIQPIENDYFVDPGMLSAMAAQAVRMRVREYLQSA